MLPKFDADVAWKLGTLLREKSLEYSRPVAINISTPSGQTLFHTLTKPGASLDNDGWIARKRKVVVRFNRASFYMGCKARAEGKSISSFGLDEKEYAFHGGGFPIRVQSVEPIVAIVVVSGLRQDQDHGLVVEALTQLKKEL